jgi:hypothetical protein
VTYGELFDNPHNIWNLLFFTGYLKKADTEPAGADNFVNLSLPNEEVKSIYTNTIRGWFDTKIIKDDHTMLAKALLDCDTGKMAREINRALMDSISFFDNAENFYHGFMVGVLRELTKEYYVKSNRETGNGRSDIMVYSALDKSFAAILELKAAPTVKRLAASCDEALAQIGKNNYRAELEDLGFSNIRNFGIAFFGKECLVKMGE